MPPGIEHGSVSRDGFKNISVGGDLEPLFCFDKPCVLSDNASQEGRVLATLIHENRYSGIEYLCALCTAYVRFLVQNIQKENSVASAVGRIVTQMTQRAYEPGISLSELLCKSGYAECYIRARFKEVTGMTPNAFLTKIRIDHACLLIDIYGGTMSLTEISEHCGYLDYVYFSKKFKKQTDMSPKEYRARA